MGKICKKGFKVYTQHVEHVADNDFVLQQMVHATKFSCCSAKLSFPFLLSCALQQPGAENHLVIQQRPLLYEQQVNKVKEIKHQLVELRQDSDIAFE